MNQHLSALVHDIFRLHEEFLRTRGLAVPHVLRPPAGPAEIDNLEVHLGVKLPPSYRDLLAICDGWIGFQGSLHMLSVAQQLEGDHASYIRRWKGEQLEWGEPVAVDGIVFGMMLNTNRAYLFDTATADSTGEMEAVWWDDGELERYKNLTAMLEAFREIRKRLIEDAPDLRRPPKSKSKPKPKPKSKSKPKPKYKPKPKPKSNSKSKSK